MLVSLNSDRRLPVETWCDSIYDAESDRPSYAFFNASTLIFFIFSIVAMTRLDFSGFLSCNIMPKTVGTTFAFLFVFELQQIVGSRTLRHIVLGRYHRPRAEERFFLFVDVEGSTSLAERIGPAAVHRFLDGVFRLQNLRRA